MNIEILNPINGIKRSEIYGEDKMILFTFGFFGLIGTFMITIMSFLFWVIPEPFFARALIISFISMYIPNIYYYKNI
jgi:hypothetical protein